MEFSPYSSFCAIHKPDYEFVNINYNFLLIEIRPAPHMDNLVSIYKGMEVASGVNIFITQNVVSSKLSGKDLLILLNNV